MYKMNVTLKEVNNKYAFLNEYTFLNEQKNNMIIVMQVGMKGYLNEKLGLISVLISYMNFNSLCL